MSSNSKIEKELALYKLALDETTYVVETDIYGNIIYVNDKYCALMKYSREEMIGKNNRIFNTNYHTREYFVDMWRRLSSGEIFRGEFRNKTKDGEMVWLDTIIIPFTDDDGRPYKYLAVRYDITAKMNALNMREQFLANISHDLKTPLHSIISFSSFLQETALSQQQDEWLKGIKTSSEILLGLVKDLLDAYKLESGNIVFAKQTFNLTAVCNSFSQVFAYALEEKGLVFSVDINPEIPAMVVGDEFRLKQVLMNLLSNAIQYTTCGGIHLTVDLQSQNNESQILRFVVSDTGKGIPSHLVQKIFDRYRQLEVFNYSVSGHVGLGLSIVKQIIEGQGGTIEIQSKVDEGTQVIFNLPMGFAAVDEQQENKDTGSFVFKNTLALVADDSPLNRIILQKHLTKYGIQILQAKNGVEVLKLVEKNTIDILFLDLQMPVMDGFETMANLQKMFDSGLQKFPVYAVTARILGNDEEKLKNLSIAGVLPKPFNADELFNLLKQSVVVHKMETSTIQSKIDGYKHLDLATLEMITEGDVSTKMELISFFIENVTEELLSINHALHEKNINNVRLLVHKMASQVNLIGIKQAYKLLAEAEQLCVENNLAEVQTRFVKAEKAINSAIGELNIELETLKKTKP